MNGNNVVDSSGWLEYLIGTDRAGIYADAVTDVQNLIVPTITIYEVAKHILRSGDENDAITAINAMIQGKLVDLDLSIALEAARFKLPLADGIIYATAQKFNATLWTQDGDFEGLQNVRYFAK